MFKEFQQGFEIERRSKAESARRKEIARRQREMHQAREARQEMMIGSHPVRDFIDKAIDYLIDKAIQAVTGDSPHKDEPKTKPKSSKW